MAKKERGGKRQKVFFMNSSNGRLMSHLTAIKLVAHFASEEHMCGSF